MNKKCTKCKEFKSFNEFYKHKSNIDKLFSRCKICENKITKNYFRTKKGLIIRIYGHQEGSSKHRNHPLPSYTKQELKDWLFSQKLFHKLHENWIKSNFDKILTPSVDRKDDNLPYSFDNIQLMTWGENNNKARKDMRSGKLINNSKPQKPVIQYDKQGNFIAEYVSVQQAYRGTGISFGNISMVCRGVRKYASGFVWKFK